MSFVSKLGEIWCIHVGYRDIENNNSEQFGVPWSTLLLAIFFNLLVNDPTEKFVLKNASQEKKLENMIFFSQRDLRNWVGDGGFVIELSKKCWP